MQRLGSAATVLVLVLVLSFGPAAGAAASGRATVLAASSLTEVLPRIDPRARYSFSGSDTLAFQIGQGAPADVFAAASPKYPEDLFARGLVLRPHVFATNSLVLVVPRGNPANIVAVGDIATPGVSLVIGDASVPIGAYTRTVLGNLGLSGALSNVVSNEQDARAVLAKVALGEADAGVVYLTDARAAGGRVRVIRLPARAQPTVRYEIAVVRGSANRPAARAFVARVLGPAGRRALRAAGFGLPPAR
ncbi:MAG: molybdate transport system substrate-binding protein [Miltoncostaeaceae bacterium]|jgi:molybdate transport system substrate-binding protein|nr:molybdate transport system substrate-binding protein [Miltoncostaeaceae bacterium]